jgi:hypothetical protein
MNDAELEQLLRRDRAEHVADDGFSERTMARLPSGARRRRLIVPAAVALGVLAALLLPSGAGAMLAALRDLASSHASVGAALIVLVPLALVFAASALLVADER